MDFNLKDEHYLIQKTARDFASNELLPEAVDRDREKRWPSNEVKKTCTSLLFFFCWKGEV